MAQLLLSTTGTLSPVPIADLGLRKFIHPTTDFDLLAEEFYLEEIRDSADLQSAINNGYITIKNEDGINITDLSTVETISISGDILIISGDIEFLSGAIDAIDTPTLSAVLGVGNSTNGNDLIVNSSDTLIVSGVIEIATSGVISGATGTVGADVNIRGGEGTVGNGGDILIQGGNAPTSGQYGSVGIGINNTYNTTIGAENDIILGADGDISIHGINQPKVDGTVNQIVTTNGAGDLSFSTAYDLVSSEFSTVSTSIDNNTTDILTLSAQLLPTPIVKDSVIIPANTTKFVAGLSTVDYRSATWDVTLINAVSSEYLFLEMAGIHLSGGIVRGNTSNMLGDSMNVEVCIEISGSEFGLNVTNNEVVDLNLQFIRLA
jgi:hypothetical protein